MVVTGCMCIIPTGMLWLYSQVYGESNGILALLESKYLGQNLEGAWGLSRMPPVILKIKFII